MMKTILVPTSGSDSDESVFHSALAAGRPLGAHLCFLHLRLTAATAALNAHLEFCPGPVIVDAFEALKEQELVRSAQAIEHFEAFCGTHGVPVREAPDASTGLSASWLEESGEPEKRLRFHARHNDLVVLGRRHHSDHLSRRLIESLLVESGRPVLLAPSASVRSLCGTVVVGWKETATSARALALALPLLKRAKQVVLLGVAEAGKPTNDALHDCARQLLWHGIKAHVRMVGDGSRPAALELTEAAAQEHAELLVMGGFGRGPLRELVFGGVIQTLIDHADLPVLMAH